MAFSKVWWHVDDNGQRIGYMDPIEFGSILAGYYGDKVWVRMFADDFGFSQPTVYRWNQGITPIPRHTALIVLMLAKLGGPKNLPKLDTPWLPQVDATDAVPGHPVATPKKTAKTVDRTPDLSALDRLAAAL